MAQRYALVIGISSYHRSLGNLTKPATDAQAVARCLRHHGGFEVTLLTETLPLEALRGALKQFLLEQANGNDALIYFTGHGILLESTTGYRETFLAASDTEIIRQASKPMEPLYILPFGEVNSLIQQSNLSSLVLLLDCCHSGDMLERDPVERALSAFNSTQRNYCFITACRSFEESRAKRSDQHSLFTGALLEALAAPTRSEDESTITSGLLFYRLSQSLKGSGQEALHLGWGNDIAIATYPAVKSADSEPALNLANPYIGLASFDAATANYFYGREQAVRALQARLVNCRVLTVFGPSGCGKSSLIKAGLLPELRDRPFESTAWEVEMLTPTAQPLQVLGDRLTQRSQSTAPFVLFIDQFEELFTLCAEEAEHRQFIQLMTTAIATMQHLKRVIIAIRGDFLDNCAKIPESATLINRDSELTTYMVTHLSASEMVSAIERPAAQHGVTFERGLVPQIIADVGDEPGALPLLQYALTQLWQVCTQSRVSEAAANVLTFAGYQQIGGVQGALQQRADQLYSSFHPDDQAFVRQLMMELVQLGEEQEVTRRKASWNKLRAIASHAQLMRVVERLTHERLIVTDEKTVEVAHEALLSEWTLLKNWIEENRENIRLSRRLEADCHDWQEKAKSEDYLLSAGRLAAIQEWVAKEQPKLTHTETEFLKQSVEKRDRELQAQVTQERRLREAAEGRAIAEIGEKIEAEKREKEALGRVKAEKRTKNISLLASMLVITALGLGSLAYIRQIQVDDEKKSKAATLVANIEKLLGKNNELEALIASIETIKEFKQMEWTDSNDLNKIKLLVSKVRKRNEFKAHKTDVNSISFSQDGNTLVSGGDDGTIRIWNLETNQLLPLISGHQDVVTSIEFSPDQKTFASASTDGSIKLWNFQGKIKHHLQVNKKEPIFSVSFSSDGNLLAASGENGNIFLWDLSRSPKFIASFFAGLSGRKQKRIYSLDFHPKSKFILVSTGFGDYDIAIWDLKRRALKPLRIGDIKGASLLVKINHKGNIIASLEGRGRIDIQDFKTLKTVGRIENKNNISHFDFSPNDSLVVSTSTNGDIQTWSINDAISKWKDGKKRELEDSIEEYKIYSPSAYSISFRPDSGKKNSTKSQLIASANYNGYVEIWDMSNYINRSIDINKKISFDGLSSLACAKVTGYLTIKGSLEGDSRNSRISRLCN